MLNGHVFTAPDGLRGIDCNQRLARTDAEAFYEKGFRFAVRYVRRSTKHSYDLSTGEATEILGAALGLMVVQHVADEGWSPNSGAGRLYGTTAALESEAVGVPPGVTVWCDLEGVSPSTPAKAIIDYCNNWHMAVSAAGYHPGLYVGWRCGLSAEQLHDDLRFTSYWSGYNLDSDQFPAIRGVQMKQSAAKASDFIPGFDHDTMDVDTIHTDKLGARPTLLAAPDWDKELAS